MVYRVSFLKAIGSMEFYFGKCCTFAPGEMAEWSIAAVLKTVDLQGSGGSNPSLSAKWVYVWVSPKPASERCQSGRMGRSRKPLTLVRGSQGSNPCLSARIECCL